MIIISLAWKSGDHVGAETEHGQPVREPFDARAIRFGRVPVPAHPLENPIRARLQRRMQMRGEVPRTFDQEMRERVVDFGCLDARETETHCWDGGNERLEQPAE